MLYGDSKTDVVSAPDSRQSRSYQDQKDCQRLRPGGGGWGLFSWSEPEWQRGKVSRERWPQSARLSPATLSSCPTGRHERTTWRQNRENVCKFQIKRAKQHCWDHPSNTQRDNEYIQNIYSNSDPIFYSLHSHQQNKNLFFARVSKDAKLWSHSLENLALRCCATCKLAILPITCKLCPL